MHKKWPALAALACGSFMATLESGILNIALPTLTRHFEAPLTTTKWVVAIYSLVATLSLLPIGMLSDRLGRKVIYVTGIGIFFLGSLGSFFSFSLYTLIGSRGLQGLGASMMMTNSPVILSRDFNLKERAFALGLLNMMVNAGLLAGPILASLLLSSFDWHMIFLLSMPLSISALFLALSGIPRDPDSRLKQKAPIDYGGVILQILFVLLVLQINEPLFISRIYAILLSVLVFSAFLFLEQRHPKPMLSFKIFRRGIYLIGNLIAFWMMLPLAILNTLTPSFLEQSGYPTLSAGGLFALFPGLALMTAPFSGKWTQTKSPRILTLFGSLMSASIFILWSFLLPGLGSYWYVHAASLAGLGIAYGLFLAPNNLVIIGAMSQKEAGMSAAVMAVIRNLALTIGAQLAPLLYMNTSMETCLRFSGFFAIIAWTLHFIPMNPRGLKA